VPYRQSVWRGAGGGGSKVINEYITQTISVQFLIRGAATVYAITMIVRK